MAAQDGELDATRLLLKAGARVNSIHHPGGTPLHLAAEEGNALIVKALTEANADPEILDDVRMLQWRCGSIEWCVATAEWPHAASSSHWI